MDKEIGYKGDYLGDTASSSYATWYSKDKIGDIKDESLKNQLTEILKKLNTKE